MTQTGPKTSKTSPRVAIQRVLGKAETLLRVGSETADVLAHLGPALTVPGVAAVGLRVLNSVRNVTAQHASRFFKGWRRLEDWGYASTLFRACQHQGQMAPADGVKSDEALVCDIYGVTIGWEKYGEDDVGGPYLQEGTDPERAYRALGRAIWDLVGARAILTAEETDCGTAAQFQSSEMIDDLASAQGNDLVERIGGFLTKGMHRSILIAGRPGTGKSCMMRFIANRVGGFSLRVPTSDIGSLTLRQLEGAVHILRPDSVLIDDLDRLFDRYNDDSSKTSLALDIIEYIARTAKVLVVSANYSDRFPKALLRPGRFDEIEVVETMDEAVLDGIIGEGVTQTLRRKLRALPVAFVVEFAKRKEAMGAEAAYRELEDLRRRAKGVHVRSRRFIREAKKKKGPKTTAQRARQYEREAASLELQAARLKERAQLRREKAVAAREKSKGNKKKAPKRGKTPSPKARTRAKVRP